MRLFSTSGTHSIVDLRLFSIRPDVGAVTDHFRKMSKGLLPRPPGGGRRQTGFGAVGSRLRLGAHTIMKKPTASTGQVVVREITAAEVGRQQARSELSATAQKRGTKSRPRKASAQSRGGRSKTQHRQKKKKKKKTPKKQKPKKKQQQQRRKKPTKRAGKRRAKRKDNFS